MSMCSKCGMEVNENAMFCANCGEKNEVVMQQASAIPQSTTYQSTAIPQPVVQQATPVQQTVAEPQKKVDVNLNKEVAMGYVGTAKEILLKPVDAIKANVNAKAQPMLIMLAIQGAIAFLLSGLIMPLTMGLDLGWKYNLQLGAMSVVIIAFATALISLIVMLLSDKKDANTFLELVGEFGAILIPATCLNVVAVIFGIFSSGLAAGLWLLGILIWVLLSGEVAKAHLPGRDNIIHYIVAGTTLCAAGVGYLFLQRIISAIFWSLLW